MSRRLQNDSDARVFSRELSWLAFNDRVLDEAEDATNPLLERLKYLSIVSSNLEEFFMVRVAQLHRLNKTSTPDSVAMRDGFPISALLKKIKDWVFEQKDRQARQYEIVRIGLGKIGLFLEEEDTPLAKSVFENKILPTLAPIRLAEGDPLPNISTRTVYLLARHTKGYSLIRLPPDGPRILIEKKKHVFLADRLIKIYKDLVFKNQDVQEIISFKILRDAEIELDEDSPDVLKDVEEALSDRDTGAIVRLDIDALARTTAVKWLQKQLNVEKDLVYQVSLPVGFRVFAEVYNNVQFMRQRFPFATPQQPPSLPTTLSRAEFFKVLDERDILLHHPFVSFDPVVELVRKAAEEPTVTRIAQTLYRTSGKSEIVEALINAAKKGKKVTVLVEIKARFDEANNIRWARELERAGARVIYGTPDLKVHAKLTYVERQVGDTKKSYVHVATGNYHPLTARFYTDLGIITSDESYSADASQAFDQIEDLDEKGDFSILLKPESFSKVFKKWIVAPAQLHLQIIKWIENETTNALAGRPSGLRAKMNGLVEPTVIEALYRASQAGVKIDLIVRGICCLRPGVRGLSENIRVRSLVDKYLEHSRMFIFENNGQRQAFISSADWMPRNFFRRIELAVPLLNSQMIEYLSETIWRLYDSDNTRSRICDSNGVYRKVVSWSAPDCRAQFELEKIRTPDFARESKAEAPTAKMSQGEPKAEAKSEAQPEQKSEAKSDPKTEKKT